MLPHPSECLQYYIKMPSGSVCGSTVIVFESPQCNGTIPELRLLHFNNIYHRVLNEHFINPSRLGFVPRVLRSGWRGEFWLPRNGRRGDVREDS